RAKYLRGAQGKLFPKLGVGPVFVPCSQKLQHDYRVLRTQIHRNIPYSRIRNIQNVQHIVRFCNVCSIFLNMEYPHPAIMGTAAKAATIPIVRARLKCSCKKKRASRTVIAGWSELSTTA